jgi:hypothetical protein
VQPHPSTPAERVSWIGRLLAHEGEYGVVTALSREVGTSRQTLTTWRSRARALLEQGLPPRAAVAAPSLERCILTLVVRGHASYRGIQACLAELLGWEVGVATIAAVVAEAGGRAAAVLGDLVPPAPVALALDEIFGGAPRHGYLNAVDAHSGVVLATAGPAVPAVAAWETVLGGLAAHGVTWASAVHDGGKPAAGGVAAVTPAVPRQRDLWHVLHRCAQAQARLERLVAAAEAKWEAAERYAAAVAAGRTPRYRPPALPAAAQAEAVDALARTAADLRSVTAAPQHLLAVVVVGHDRLLDLAARRVDVATVLALVEELAPTAPAAAQPELRALHGALTEASAGLVVFAAALDPVHRDLAGRIGAAGVALVGWAWLRRAVLGDGETLVTQLPPDWHPAARVLIAAWTGAVRASSAVEGWHSLLRPHLAVHRGLSPALQALLAVAHNHRVAPRGLHAGTSPLQRCGLPDAPADWLTALDYRPTQPCAPGRHRRREEERLAA